MVKEKLYSFMSINCVNFAFDLCEEKEDFLNELKISEPQKVIRFNSKGTYWFLKYDNVVSGFNLCINNGKLHTADYCGSFIYDFLEFLPQLAYYNNKSLICGFDCEAKFDCLTAIPVDNNSLRISTFTDCSYKPKIQSDIIIKKDTFLKQIHNILIKIDKDVTKVDKGHENSYLRDINIAKRQLEQYLNNPDEFRQKFNPITHARVFDIAYKTLEGIWQFVVCLDDDERCEPEYWEKQKQEGKILDYDYAEQQPHCLAVWDYKNRIANPITKEKLKTKLHTYMRDRVTEKNWVYSAETKKWYATDEIMDKPKLQNYGRYHYIQPCDTFEVNIVGDEDKKIELYLYSEDLEEDSGFLTCNLNIVDYDSVPDVCIKFDYKYHKQIRDALERVEKDYDVRFNISSYKPIKMHIWQSKYGNKNEIKNIMVSAYEESDDFKHDKELYCFNIDREQFVQGFLSALDVIQYKINVIKHVLKQGEKLDINNKFKLTSDLEHKFEYLENFVGDYACACKNSSDGWGILDKDLKWVIKPENATIYGETDPKWGRKIKGFIAKYTYLQNIDGKLFIAAKLDKKRFVMDINGDIKIPHISDEIYYTYLNDELYFLAVDYNKTYIINSKGEDVVTLDFPVGEKFWLTSEIIIVSKDNKFGIVDWKGNIIIDFIFSDININPENLDFIAVKFMDIWGLVSKSGEIIDLKVKNNDKL